MDPQTLGTRSRGERVFRFGCLLTSLLSLGWLAFGGYLVYGFFAGPKTITEPITVAEDLDAACGGTRFAQAPAYEGAPPHPVVIFVQEHTSDTVVGRSYDEHTFFDAKKEGGLGESWAPYLANTPANLQLVACAKRVETSDTEVKTCDYITLGEVPIYRATWEVSVYELRTGGKLGSTTMEGAVNCPEEVTYLQGSKPKVYAIPAHGSFRDFLARYVEQ